MTAQQLELTATVLAILSALGAGIAVWVRLNNQLAVLQDRSDREESDDDAGSALIDELRRQIEEQRDEIAQLRREVREERAARERQEQRHAREITDLNDQLNSVSQRLAIARQRLSGLDGQI